MQNAISGAMLLLKLASLYFLVVALFALKKPKPIPRANPNMRFACVIAARNEERVIGGLIESLLRQTYPKALFDIYVMPNNCTDHTALAAIRAGAQVLRPEGEIRCKGDAVQTTERGGKVVAVNGKGNTPGGKSVTVEYARQDGSKVQCTYMHLGDIAVKAGDTVQAGQRLGTSGNTGTRTTGEHLHFGVRQIHADGTQRDIDPAAYLAEIAQKGNIKQQALHNGNDLLAKYRDAESIKENQPLSPDAWMKKLLSSEDSGVGMSGCNDPIVEMAMTAFTSLMLLAAQIESKNEEEQRAAVSAAMDSRRIDLESLVRGMKACEVVIGENDKAMLRADNGSVEVSRELTSAELSRLSATLNNGTLSEEAKRLRVAGLLNTVILSETASRNFEQGMSEQQGQAENLKR